MRFGMGLGAMLLAGTGTAWAQEAQGAQGDAAPVRYEVSFPNAVHHEARISLTYRNAGSRPLVFQMSRSSPGRYAVHEFAKNVYSVTATDGNGRPLAISRTDPYSWTVPRHDGHVTLTYTLYADRADGTYSQVDATHAHLNMPATFMWARGFDRRPIEIVFRPHDPAWKVATQLAPTQDPRIFRAPNLQYFMDSPTELSDHVVREWQVRDGAATRTIRIALHHAGSDADADRFAALARRVVDQQIAIFGGDVPDFDFGTYTFLADYLPHVASDGMEHRNSTYLTGPQGLREAEFDQIGTLSHEFFHAWNVERLRPAELEPFDFTRANPTPSLWFAEGFTTYYGPLAIRRAGVSTVDAFLAEMGGMLDGVVTAPARGFGSPQEMSLRAPFVDAATAIDPTNNSNIFVSYYTYGAVLALALDLSIRQRFPNLTLDDYMRRLWRSHGAPERPFRPGDLEQALAATTGDAAFARAFFAASIEGSALPDVAPLLDQAGLKLRPANPARASLGRVQISPAGGRLTIAGATLVGTPLYAAGLDRGDQILSLGGQPVTTGAEWTAALARHRPGQSTQIRYLQRGRERTATIAFVADPALEIVRYESAGLTPSPAQLAFRARWLSPEAPPNP